MNFMAYASLFSIKSDVLKLDTTHEAYSVNKGLFLGVFLAMVARQWDVMYIFVSKHFQELQ